MEAFPWSSGLEKKIQNLGHLKIHPPPFFFRGLKVTGRPPSRSEVIFLSQKRFSFLHFDALIAILIVEGREVVFRKARDELYHVVGSVKHGSDRFTIRSDPCCGFCPKMHWRLGD